MRKEVCNEKMLPHHEGKCSELRKQKREKKKPPVSFKLLFKLLELASLFLKILHQLKDLFCS